MSWYRGSSNIPWSYLQGGYIGWHVIGMLASVPMGIVFSGLFLSLLLHQEQSVIWFHWNKCHIMPFSYRNHIVPPAEVLFALFAL
jgi:hypothetical protein